MTSIWTALDHTAYKTTRFTTATTFDGTATTKLLYNVSELETVYSSVNMVVFITGLCQTR